MAANTGNYIDALRRKLGASKGKGAYNLTHVKGKADPKAQAIAEAIKSKGMTPPAGAASKARPGDVKSKLLGGGDAVSIREALKKKITGTPTSGPTVAGTKGFGGRGNIPPNVTPTKPPGGVPNIGGRTGGPYFPGAQATPTSRPPGASRYVPPGGQVPLNQKPRRRKPGSGPYAGGPR